MALSITFNHAQTRVARPRIQALGQSWSRALSSDVWRDPVTGTVMLKPAPLYEAWWTSGAGNYAKLTESSYTITTASAWVDAEYSGASGVFNTLKGQDTNESVITASSYDKNRGFYLAWVQASKTNAVAIQGGWNSSASLSGGVGFKIYASGDIEVYKSGTLVGTGKISGIVSPQSLAELLIIPMRRRELLFYSPHAEDGYLHSFEDIEEDDADPTITPASKFWWEVPTPATPQVACAPLKFPTSGTLVSTGLSLCEPPETGAAFETFDNDSFAGGSGQSYRIYGDDSFEGTVGASASLVQDDGSTAFTANGSSVLCRVKVSLTGDGNYTPFIYAALRAYSPAQAITDDSEAYDALDAGYVVACQLDVPESPSGVEGSFTISDPPVVSDSVPNLLSNANTPIEFKIGEQGLLDGRQDSVSWEDGMQDEVKRATFHVRDPWKALEKVVFVDPVPLDGLSLEDALAFLLAQIAYTGSQLDLDVTGVTVGNAAGQINGEFSVLIQIGDTADQWVTRLIDDYAATFIYGFLPTADGYKFWLKDPVGLGLEPDITLYRTIEDAISTGGYSEDEAWRYVYWEASEHVIEPEGNDVRVSGYDHRLGKGIQSWVSDAASVDPTTAPSARPGNWIGEKWPVGIVDDTLNSQGVTDLAAQQIYDRVSPVRAQIAWGSFFLLRSDGAPIWKGHNVRLDGLGTYRVGSLSASFILEVDDDIDLRRTGAYTGELLEL